MFAAIDALSTPYHPTGVCRRCRTRFTYNKAELCPRCKLVEQTKDIVRRQIERIKRYLSH